MTDTTTRAARLERLRDGMEHAGVELVALAPTDNLRWLLGFAPLYDERASLLVVGPRDAAMVMPALNAEQTAAEVPEVELVRWADEDGPVAALHEAIARASAGHSPARVAADPQMRGDHLLELQAATPGAHTIDATAVLGPLRAVKDATELGLLADAAANADRAVQAAWAACAPGVAEREVAEAVRAAFRSAGDEPEFALVGGGPHSAFPHHETGERPLTAGDAVVIDVGAIHRGYHSDITRMAVIGEPSDRYREVHAVVESAVVAAMAATRPGATCGEVDAAAREVIEDAGFGAYFVHRTGHGLGLSGHEPPWIMAGSDVVLAQGMVHSIEPGVYLPDELGVRLEEIVQVTADGCARLSELDRAVHVVA
jgi:Xaa-Pro aminopeptidase